ncbi:uncharacterized protein BYT42DRAFT_480368, partial [Radiomyces spectabilis]|uniref:uncharacterized protein n=1 Tax=Radiomyces spectabilis TaxID=64574 RepID=UPI00221E4CF5
LSLGESESSWWHQNVFGFHWDDGEVNHLLARAGFTRHYPLWLFHLLWSILGAWPFTLISGFNLPVLRTARNPGFYDPWPYDDVTLENPSYGGLFKAKLDWTLVRYFKVVQKWTGNADYRASDHRYLMVRITPDEVTQTEDSNYHVTWAARRRQYEEESALAMISRRKSAIVTALIIAVI